MELLQHCPSMISAVFEQLKEFCLDLDTSCTELRSRMLHMPAPSYCDATSLLDGLNDRLSQTNAEVEALKDSTFGTICFQELMGHCMVLYKENEVVMRDIEDTLASRGYVPGTSTNEPCPEQDIAVHTSANENSKFHSDKLFHPQSLSCVDGSKLSMIGTEVQGIPPAPTSVPTAYTPLLSCLRQTNEAVPHPLISRRLSISDLGLSAEALAIISREEDSLSEVFPEDNTYYMEESQNVIDQDTLKEDSLSEVFPEDNTYYMEESENVIDQDTLKGEVSPKKTQSTILCTQKNSENMLAAVPAGLVEQIKSFLPTKEYSEGISNNGARSIQDLPVCTSADENSHLHSNDLICPQNFTHVDGLKVKTLGVEIQGILPAATSVSTGAPLHSFLRQTSEAVLHPLVSRDLSVSDFQSSAAGLVALSREEDSTSEVYQTDNTYYREEAQSVIDQDTLKGEVSPKKTQTTILCAQKNSENMLAAVLAGHVEQIKTFLPTKEYSEEKFSHALIAEVSLEDFNKSPTWIKCQVSLQEMNDFVNKLNSLVVAKNRVADPFINQEDVTSLCIGEQTRKACFLLLLRLERLVPMHSIGSTSYRIKK